MFHNIKSKEEKTGTSKEVFVVNQLFSLVRSDRTQLNFAINIVFAISALVCGTNFLLLLFSPF